MDVGFFLKKRITFVRNFYAAATRPFQTIQSQIENEEEPFIPPYSEDGEPPFLEEWIDAETSGQMVGRTCVSMLSESVKLYFQTWEQMFRIKCQATTPAEFKKGFLAGYKACFGRLVSDRLERLCGESNGDRGSHRGS